MRPTSAPDGGCLWRRWRGRALPLMEAARDGGHAPSLVRHRLRQATDRSTKSHENQRPIPLAHHHPAHSSSSRPHARRLCRPHPRGRWPTAAGGLRRSRPYASRPCRPHPTLVGHGNPRGRPVPSPSSRLVHAPCWRSCPSAVACSARYPRPSRQDGRSSAGGTEQRRCGEAGPQGRERREKKGSALLVPLNAGTSGSRQLQSHSTLSRP
uniref:Uncharacterized protein n=1 Tax=Setaria viridis TaxID=4556 RepID=A0A4U6VGH1_SETVI|nr:hypothetical protein SEVIR_3G188801v2 [Setaria viridis]